MFIGCLTSSVTFPIILVSCSALTSLSKCQNYFNLYGSVSIFNWNPKEKHTLQKSSSKFNLPSELDNVRLYFAISFTHYLSREYNLQDLQYIVVQRITKHKIPLKINISKGKSVLISDMLERKYFVLLIKNFLSIIFPWSLAFKYSCFLCFQ